MSNWLSRLLSGKDAGRKVDVASPADTSDRITDSVAQRRRGNECLNRGDVHGAIESYRQAVASDPNSVDAHTSLGFGLKEAGELEAAQAAFRAASKLQPHSFDSAYLLAQTCFELRQFEKAAEYFEKALALQPTFESLYGELGQALFEIRSMGRAHEVISEGIRRFPGNALFHFFRGNLCCATEKWAQATSCYRTALQLKPDLTLVHNNLANALKSQGKFLEAESYYRAALAVEPESDISLSNLGGALLAQGRLSEAVANLRRAIEINPRFTTAHGNLLFALSVDPQVTKGQYLNEAIAFGNSLANSVGQPFCDWLVELDDQAAAPLRVGLVSGKLCRNPVGYFLESVIANIDSSKVALVAYDTGGNEDELTRRIRPHFAQWENIVGMESTAVARKIRADRIHILVDLNGHTEGNLLPVFALKPSPVQVSWLGYWASTGVREIDYILADETGLPRTDQEYFTETVCYLPETRLCFTAPEPELPVAPLPATRNGFVTFGCFQARTKVNDNVLALWGQILKEVPGSRMNLASDQIDDAASLQEFLGRLQSAGIDPARVSVSGPVSREKYLANYGAVDIVLDTFPFTGGTTTCEALWMGVPTLTLAGTTMIARQGVAMLGCVGLVDWIARDETDYAAKAISYATALDDLAILRSGLRDRALRSALFDAPRFARHLEAAFSAMWQQKRNLAMEPG